MPLNDQDLQRAFKNREILKALSDAKQQRVADLANHFDVAKVSIDELQKAALESNPTDLFKAVKAAIIKADQYIGHLQQQNASNDQLLGYIFNYINALSGLSPTLEKEYIKIKMMLDETQKTQAIVALLYRLKNMQHNEQIYQELEQALNEAFKQAQEARKNYTQALKQSINQVETAKKELSSVTDRVIESSHSNGYYDPLRRIGFMLYAMYDLYYLAPYEMEVHPNSKYAEDKTDPRSPFLNLNNQMYGSEGYTPPAGATPAAAPAAPKVS